jgi:murein DD-endopeptidase MepM/ murein hydrolase activator NlpD
MRKNRRDSIRRERIIMLASSAFVLTALTLTGLYMKGQEAKQQDDGYTLDFTALGNSSEDKLQEIADTQQAKNDTAVKKTEISQDNDLDYMPLEEELSAEAGSHLVEIPGLTDTTDTTDIGVENTAEDVLQEEATFHFTEEQGLTRPVSGEILLPYSMDGSIYFATLDQYKYNPATVFVATEGESVVSCAEGQVTNIFEDAELGKCVTIDLGDGYVATYGQLTNIQVAKDGYVKAGTQIGSVAAPSRYYSLEGTNLYFRLEKDGQPVNAENLF